MFNLTYDSPCKIQGTIEVKEPIYYLGPVTDIYGKKWNIRGIFGVDGKTMVQAYPESSLHPYYTDTSGQQNFGVVHQKWLPYKVKVVSNK